MDSQLAVSYLGLALKSPILVGSCPLTLEPETVRQLTEAGAGAIVLPSMLQEQITHWQLKATDPLAAIERSGYLPQQDRYNGGPEKYLATIESLKASFPIPIIGSLNGGGPGDWLDYARDIEAAGADALELNLQPVIADHNQSSDQVEEQLCLIVRDVCQHLSIPVAVKLSQRFTNLATMTYRLQATGAAGVVLFAHAPHWDISIDRMHWTVSWELSPLNTLGNILEGLVRAHARGLAISIAASSGICTAEDSIKAMIAGADVVMVTSEIYRKGPDAVRQISDGIINYLKCSHHGSLEEFQRARPILPIGSAELMRMEYVDPLTRSNYYFDPTPNATTGHGDAFGHNLPNG